MGKKHRSKRQSQDGVTALVAAMTPLVYVMTYAIITVLNQPH